MVMQPVSFLRSTCVGRPVFGLLLCHHHFNIFEHGFGSVFSFHWALQVMQLVLLRNPATDISVPDGSLLGADLCIARSLAASLASTY